LLLLALFASPRGLVYQPAAAIAISILGMIAPGGKFYDHRRKKSGLLLTSRTVKEAKLHTYL
jgi:hypothetical protein